MNLLEVAILILFFAIISVPLANRLRLPLEVFLVIGSCFISLLPGLPDFQINPVIVFYLFLPPILFFAGYFTSWRDFKVNLRPISLLAVGLVIFTAIGVAIIAKLLLPGLTWGQGFLLGAIVSPTDASSATTVIKKLGAPRRLIAILEGESLINDATALLLFRFSLIAILSGSFSFPNAVSQFFIISLGGIIVGLAIGFVAIFFLKILKDSLAETTLTFITAFSCYAVAEHLGVSGIISTVVCGIYFGIYFPQFAESQTKMNAKASWMTLLFIINGLVFSLIGLQLPWIIKNLEEYSIYDLIYYGFAISLSLIAMRIVWIFLVAYLSRLLFPSIKKYDPMPSWQQLFILGWVGMRGIVSLAAALSIPFQLSLGISFPHRDLFLFITFCVIVVTLLLPALTLPFLLESFQMVDSEDKTKEEALARILALEETLKKVKHIIQYEKIPANIFQEFTVQIERKLLVIKTQLADAPYSTLNEEYLAVKKLALLAISIERETIIRLRKEGKVHDEVFHHLSDELDLEEMRAKTFRI